MIIYRLSLLILVMLFQSCSKSKKIELEVDFPMKNTQMISLFNLSSGEECYSDTLKDGKLTLDSLKAGIYLVNLKWEKDLISIHEFKALRPNTVDEDKFYVIQKMIFVDPFKNCSFKWYEDNLKQDELEQIINSGNNYDSKLEVIMGEQSKLFDEYDNIYKNIFDDYLKEQKSLNQQMYSYNDNGDLAESKKVNKLIQSLWSSKYNSLYENKEQQFLLNHNNEIVTPFILLYRITDKEKYLKFKKIIDVLPAQYQELTFIKQLANYN